MVSKKLIFNPSNEKYLLSMNLRKQESTIKQKGSNAKPNIR